MTTEKYTEVKFDPWVGKHYGRNSEHKVRLLILGKSHHSSVETKTLTTKVIQEHAQGKDRLAFFTKCSTVMLRLHKSDLINDRSSQAERWEHVAFYNYIQSSLSGPDKQPSKVQWEEAFEPFKEILREQNPDAVWILGEGLWNKIDHEELRKEYPKIVFKKTWDASILSYDKSIPTVQGLIKEAQRRVQQ